LTSGVKHLQVNALTQPHEVRIIIVVEERQCQVDRQVIVIPLEAGQARHLSPDR
jgi:hypothetical protein